MPKSFIYFRISEGDRTSNCQHLSDLAQGCDEEKGFDLKKKKIFRHTKVTVSFELLLPSRAFGSVCFFI